MTIQAGIDSNQLNQKVGLREYSTSKCCGITTGESPGKQKAEGKSSAAEVCLLFASSRKNLTSAAEEITIQKPSVQKIALLLLFSDLFLPISPSGKNDINTVTCDKQQQLHSDW